MKKLVLHFSRSSDMADFEEASLSAFRQGFGDVNVTGCWFHFDAQSIIKRIHKLGLNDEYVSEPNVQNPVYIRCLLGRSAAVAAGEISPAFNDVNWQ